MLCAPFKAVGDANGALTALPEKFDLVIAHHPPARPATLAYCDAARIEHHRLAVDGMNQVQRHAELWVIGDFDALFARSGNRRHV